MSHLGEPTVRELPSRLPLVLAMTGASGAVYGVRLLEVALQLGLRVELVMSPAAAQVIRHELGLEIDIERFQPEQLWYLRDGRPWWTSLGEPFRTAGVCLSAGSERTGPLEQGRADGGCRASDAPLVFHHYQDCSAPPASGSHRTCGMVICPCSGGTLSGVAHGASNNLILRAAEVHLKERRRLILVPRETPLSLPYVENLRQAVRAGVVVLPASPGWYHGVQRVHDLVDFVVARILDHLEVEHRLVRRWGEQS